ncbi:MAG: aa3-type cytochrome c oxidase subunit IV [Hyphomicrobiales bacterium]|nr:MAG: aa3-type cytochrome c oxidase subunit IV [Hyphomicrobiales bacterium]
MDYVQHNGTYHGFTNAVKWSCISAAIIMLSLYAFIEAHQPLIGGLLLLLIPIGAVVLAVTNTRRS